ncbi:extracellular solute-binding protein [Paenibacillus flagellatus]|uniref:ABC transporter substrate-binding protein n=1 Tax=Paenibacillus flagellatus TaxID=2211139 RepID=A0A2V5KA50_9BACL|nr:extracellular solute-binding protein [Paenibacillus flagellatus]PYI56421.1 ABC transporter substrate-binding protein [Paenibacillus flagellatus]
MKRSRIAAVWMAAVWAALGLLPACEPGGETFEGAEPARDAPHIEVLVSGSELPDPNDDDIKKALDAKLNIDLNIVECLGDACRNQLNVRLAEGSLPDLFYVNRRDMVKLARQGSILDLSPYADLLAPAVAFTGIDDPMFTTVDGKRYGLPRADTSFQYSYWIREDWLDKLGLDPPADLDGLLETAKAMTERDPDGNGKRDTFGFSGSPSSALGPIFGAFGTTYPGHFYIKNGKLVNSLYDPDQLTALAFAKRMVDAGVVDPDFLSNTQIQNEAKAFQGQVGLIYYNWPNLVNDNKVREWQPLNPNARWAQVPAPRGPGGASTAYNDVGARNILVLSAKLAQQPAKLDKIIRLLAYLSSDEGSRLVLYGIEGKHYKRSNGTIVPTDKMPEAKYSYLYQLIGRDEMVYLRTKFPKQEPYFTFAMNEPRIDVYDSLIDPPPGFSLTDAGRFIQEEMFKFIYGKRPLDSYGDFLRTLETEYRYGDYMRSAEAQLKELGVWQ